MRRARSWFALCLLPLALSLSGCSGCAADVVGAGDGGADAGGGDAGEGDDGGAPSDAGGDDAGAPDGGSDDAGPVDGGEDAGAPDGGPVDGGPVDGGPVDGGTLDAGPMCLEDSDCSLGELCLAGACVPGCADDRDCPEALPLCDADLGPNGSCVLCLVDTDCPTAGDVCQGGACYASCTTANPTCPSGLVCDATAGVCVGCVEDSDCSLGEICEDRDCTPGCRENRDCPEGQICGADNQCTEGCVAAPVDTCPLGTHCVSGSCALGCNGDDARCGEGFTCVVEGAESSCQPACEDDGDCGAGTVCVDGACAAGCRVDDDCGAFTATGVCDTTAGTPGACVQCLIDDDCPTFPVAQVCDTAARTCRVPCSSTGQLGCIGGVCDTANDVCVQCLDDDDCDAGETCDATTKACAAPAAPLCGACQDDADCAGDDSLCVRRELAPFVVETACGIDCSDAPCPQGYACVFVGEPVVRGRQCVPTSSVIEAPSCEAIRDLEAEATCSFTAQCGAAPPGDAYCAGAGQGQQGQCTLPCATGADCPATYACDPPPAGAPAELPGVCAPTP